MVEVEEGGVVLVVSSLRWGYGRLGWVSMISSVGDKSSPSRYSPLLNASSYVANALSISAHSSSSLSASLFIRYVN